MSESAFGDRRAALGRMIGLAAVPVGLPILTRAFGVDRSSLIAAAHAADSPGAQPNQGDLVHIPGASAPTSMIAEWFTGDVANTSGPFRIAASKAAYEKAPATAARYEAKLYNFPVGSLRTLTFKKAGPIQHMITFETEIYVLSGSATLTAIPGHPAKPVTVSAGDALFLPTGYLNSAKASDDFVILQAFVGRSVREAKKAIISAKQAVTADAGDWAGKGGTARVKRYAGDGNMILHVTLKGGRSNTVTRSGVDLLIYVVKGKARRQEGNQMLDLVAGDCVRVKAGNAGSWEPLEETVLIATEAPMNPGMLPPANT